MVSRNCLWVVNARREALAEGNPVRFLLFPFNTYQQSLSKHSHQRSNVRLAWEDFHHLKFSSERNVSHWYRGQVLHLQMQNDWTGCLMMRCPLRYFSQSSVPMFHNWTDATQVAFRSFSCTWRGDHNDKGFPFSSYVENTFKVLFPVSALVDVNALHNNISQEVPWLFAILSRPYCFNATGTLLSNSRVTSAGFASKNIANFALAIHLVHSKSPANEIKDWLRAGKV